VIGWLKSNIVAVLLLLVPVIVIPTAWVLSSGWSKRIVADVESKASADFREVDVRVTYQGLQTDPQGRPIEQSGVVPNRVRTEFFRRLRENQAQGLERIVSIAEEFNRRGREPLVPGLFPTPTGEAYPGEKPLMISNLFVPTRDPARPSAYERLLLDINAGRPPDMGRMLETLEDIADREKLAWQAERGQTQMPPEKAEELQQRLVDYRLEEYRRRAEQLSVYGGMQVFPVMGDTARSIRFPMIPPDRPRQPPGPLQCFIWQHDYWVVQDVFEAIRRANTGPDGQLTSVPDSAVKRIVALELERMPVLEDMGDPAPFMPGPQDARGTRIEPKYEVSLTGRMTRPENPMYDARIVSNLELIVSWEKFPRFLDALARTNFITVLDLDIEEVNIAQDLVRGYYYGPDYVVRAKMKLEVLYLRSWTKQYMPDSVKGMLGIPVPEAVDEFDPDR
jgi:hypothetical protein